MSNSSKLQVDPLAGRQLALGVLTGDTALAAAGPGLFAPTFKLCEDIFHAPAPLNDLGTG
jgi:hypothetical protein